MAVVPFASSVNVGSAYRGRRGSTAMRVVHHTENFAEARRRFDLFAELGVAWRGCVEARPTFDVQDTPATGGDTRFVPMFAVDEPGDAGANDLGYANSYLNDDGGSCIPYPRVCTGGYTKRGTCKLDGDAPAQCGGPRRTCKYSGAVPSGRLGPTPAARPSRSCRSTRARRRSRTPSTSWRRAATPTSARASCGAGAPSRQGSRSARVGPTRPATTASTSC